MLLYAGVTEIMADPARKFPQMNRPIQLEDSAITMRTEQTQTPTTSARGHRGESKPKRDTPRLVRSLNNLAIFYKCPLR